MRRIHGSPLHARTDAEPDVLRIRLGTLRDDPGVRPVLRVCTASKAPWWDIADALPQLARLPGEDDDGATA